MGYQKKFDAEQLAQQRGQQPAGVVSYLYHSDLELVVNVALAAKRPILFTGLPGTGKSSIAADVAWKLNRRFYSEVITSRTQARDLQWTFDSVKRLSDATRSGVPGAPAAGVKADSAYVRPGVLWRAFSPTSVTQEEIEHSELGNASQAGRGNGAVVLLDEIDKAEPDVPNDLLVVLDQSYFVVEETGREVKREAGLDVLIILTSNGERVLPPAFLRRCITFDIPPLEGKPLREVIERHFEGKPARPDADLIDQIESWYVALRAYAKSQRVREPSTAELLDALFACVELGIKSASEPEWERIARLALWKQKEDPKGMARPNAGNSETARSA